MPAGLRPGLPPGSVVPEYGSYCVSGIPSAIAKHFGVRPPGTPLPKDSLGETKGIDNVVLFVFDGFGMSAWRQQQSEGFVKSMTEKGSVRPITTVFPSTTAAALTTFATGLTPQEHGLFEWFLYIKSLDAVIATLPFSFASDPGRETLRGRMEPRALFTGEPIFKDLQNAGVSTVSYVSRALVGTSYTSLVHKASKKVAYSSGSDMVAQLRKNLESARGPSYHYVYWSYVDTIEHRYGPATDESELEAAGISFVIQKGLIERLSGSVAKRTLIVASADHGQVPVNPRETIYLNRYRGVINRLRRLKSGRPIPATGSARDVFLHVEADKQEEAEELLAERMEGSASIINVGAAVSQGLFGLNRPCRKFKERAGSTIILPHGNGTVWYKETPDFALAMRGHHGGLSKEEMTVPLAVGRVSDLQR